MDMILATADGREERFLTEDFDLDVGETNDFQITTSYSTWAGDIQIGKLVYIPGTEYGGIIKDIESATNTGQIYVKGYTWRGYLAHRFIIPPAGQDYYIASGDVNDILRALVQIPGFITPTGSAGVAVSYQFKRYTSVDAGLREMLATIGHRLDIRYIQTISGGYVLVQAVPAANYGDTVEYSQDSLIDFESINNQMGVNHLICLGKGELRDRIVVHLYADRNGNISRTQTITGIDEIVDVYENAGAEEDTLIESGTDRLQELISRKSFTAAVKQLNMELYLGDTLTGRDYITGNTVTKPVTDKVVTRTDGELSIDYKIEGQE